MSPTTTRTPAEAHAVPIPTPAEGKILDVGDTTLWYTEVGQGPVCIVIHGGLGLDHAYFRPEMDKLAQNMRLVYFDLRGHARSGRPPTATLDHATFCADIDELRRHLGAEQVVLLGHSYGGFLALEYATRYPQHVCHLLLTGTGAKMDSWEATQAILQAREKEHPEAVDAFRNGGYHDDESFRTWLQTIGPLYWRRFKPEIGGAIFDRITFTASAGARFTTNLETYDVTAKLRDIRVPTLILHGRHDFVLPASQAERLAKGIPDATLVMFEESGHFPWIEEADKFFASIGEWFARKAMAPDAA